MQLKVDDDDLPAFDIGMTTKDTSPVEVAEDDYDSDGIDIIPEEESAILAEKTSTPMQSNLFTNLAHLTKSKSANSSPSREETISTSNKPVSKPPPTTTKPITPKPSAVSVNEPPSDTAISPTPRTSIVTGTTSSVVVSKNSEILVNAIVSDNQIVLARKISILDLKLDDIKHIDDKHTREWMTYGINGIETLKRYADHLLENRISFNLKEYVAQEFPPNLQYFDLLDCRELVVALSHDLINEKLRELGSRYQSLISHRGKRTKQYDYLIPHKAALMRNTLLGVTIVKRKIELSNSSGLLNNPKIAKLLVEGSDTCKLSRRDKRRRASSSDQSDKPKKKRCDQQSSLSKVPPAKAWLQNEQTTSKSNTTTAPTKPKSSLSISSTKSNIKIFFSDPLADSDFLKIPKPSNSKTNLSSIVKPPNSVASQSAKPATIKILAGPSPDPPSYTNNDLPDPLFVIGGNLGKKIGTSGNPSKSTPAPSKRKLELPPKTKTTVLGSGVSPKAPLPTPNKPTSNTPTTKPTTSKPSSTNSKPSGKPHQPNPTPADTPQQPPVSKPPKVPEPVKQVSKPQKVTATPPFKPPGPSPAKPPSKPPGPSPTTGTTTNAKPITVDLPEAKQTKKNTVKPSIPATSNPLPAAETSGCSPDVVQLPPKNNTPKRKQKKIIPGIIWIKPEPGTNEQPKGVPAAVPQQTTTKKCAKANCKNFCPPDKELCPVHQQKAALLEIRQMVMNTVGSASQKAAPQPAVANKPTPQPAVANKPTPQQPLSSSLPVPPAAETVTILTITLPTTTGTVPVSQVRSEDRPVLRVTGNPGTAPSNPGTLPTNPGQSNPGTVPTNPGSAVPAQFLPHLTEKAGAMINQAISYAGISSPAAQSFQSVGDFSFQRSNTLASLLKQDLECIKACRRQISQSFNLDELLTARQSPVHSEIHLYIVTVCIQDEIEETRNSKTTVSAPTTKLLSKYRTLDNSLTIYQLLNLLFNLVYTSEFHSLPVVLEWIEAITEKKKHDCIRVMALIEECFNLLQNDQLVACRYFVALSFRSLIVFENVLDKRLPHMSLDDVSDTILKLEEQGYILKDIKHPELPDLQKFGVTGEFFMLRRYVSKHKESVPRQFDKESIAKLIANKIAVRGSSGGGPAGVTTTTTSRARHPTPPASRYVPPRQSVAQNVTVCQLNHVYPGYTSITNSPQLSYPHTSLPQTASVMSTGSSTVCSQPPPVYTLPYKPWPPERLSMMNPPQRKQFLQMQGQFLVNNHHMQKQMSTGQPPSQRQQQQQQHLHSQLIQAQRQCQQQEQQAQQQHLTQTQQQHLTQTQQQQQLSHQVQTQQQYQAQLQQQMQQHPQIQQQPGGVPQSMSPSVIPPPSNLVMSPSNLVMDQQRIQQIQQLIKDNNPQYTVTHHPPPPTQPGCYTSIAATTYPQQTTAGVMLLNATPQALPQQQQEPPRPMLISEPERQRGRPRVRSRRTSQSKTPDQQPHPNNQQPHPNNQQPHPTNQQPHPTNQQPHPTNQQPHPTNLPINQPPPITEAEKRPYTIQEPGKGQRIEYMTATEAEALQTNLLEEYNKKKAEEAKQQQQTESSKEGKQQQQAESSKAPAAKSPVSSRSNKSVISDTRPDRSKTTKPVVIEIESDNEEESAVPAPPATPARTKVESPGPCTTPTIPTNVTSDNHVTSTTQSPVNRGTSEVASKNEEVDTESILNADLSVLGQKPFTDIIHMVSRLCNIETSNDAQIKELEEKKRKLDEEYAVAMNKAEGIKKRRAELIEMITEKQARVESDSDLSIIDHTTLATPSTESLRINRVRIGPISEAVKNIIKQ